MWNSPSLFSHDTHRNSKRHNKVNELLRSSRGAAVAVGKESGGRSEG